MKVNFWQILGIVILIVGVVLVARKKIGKNDVIPDAEKPPTTTLVAP